MTAAIPTAYISHFCSKSPKNDAIRTAVATYLAISKNHLPISFRISKIFSQKHYFVSNILLKSSIEISFLFNFTEFLTASKTLSSITLSAIFLTVSSFCKVSFA